MKVNSTEIVSFLRELKQNNTKQWFDENRERYHHVKKEFVTLVEAVFAELAPFDREIQFLETKNMLYRINRDIRFSKNKNPYKEWFACGICPQGKNSGWPVYYFHIDGTGKVVLGSGSFQPQPKQLASIRTYIVENPEEWFDLAAYLQEHGYEFDRSFGELKRMPRDFKNYTEFEDVMKLKSFIIDDSINVGKTIDSKKISDAFKKHARLVQWLRKAETYIIE